MVVTPLMSEAHRPVLQAQHPCLQPGGYGQSVAAESRCLSALRGSQGNTLVGCLGLDLSNRSLCTYLCFVKCKSDNKHEYLLKFLLSFCVPVPVLFTDYPARSLSITLALLEETTFLCQTNTQQTTGSHG